MSKPTYLCRNPIKNIVGIIAVACLFLFQPPTAIALQKNSPEKIFDLLLSEVEVGAILEDTIAQQADLHIPHSSDENLSIHLFESTDYSSPHFIYVDLHNKVTFLQLRIPNNYPDMYENYSSEVEPVVTYKTQTEVLVGYPLEGIAFVRNDQTNKTEKIQKFPPKAAENFQAENAKNYEHAPKDEREYFSENNGTSTAINFFKERTKWFVYGLLIVLILISAPMIYLKKKKNTNQGLRT